MRIRFLTMIFIWLLCLPVFAQDEDYPTLDELHSVIFPANDPLDLVRRLRGIHPLIEIPSVPPEWKIGDTQYFNVVNSAADLQFTVQAELRGMSEHVLLWIENEASINYAQAEQFVALVDSAIVQQVQELWGTVTPAGIDGDPRLYILMTRGLNTSVAGYFAYDHAYPRSVVPSSNQHEMMIFNLSAYGDNNILDPLVLGNTAHEFQHLLRFFIDPNEETWVDEGFSMYTEQHVGFDAGRSTVIQFLNSPNVQMNRWQADDKKAARYGSSLLFVTYFVERYGLDALRLWSKEPADGLKGLENVLAQIDSITVNDFFADWVLANYLLDPATGYGYGTVWNDLPSARPIANVLSYPYSTQDRLPQYATDYYTLANLRDKNSLTISYSMPDSVGFIPASPFEGRFFYYSLPADNADVTLTREIDLSSVDSANLSFYTWYDLEEFWDYAYVMVSRDAGATWDILQAQTMRDNNPYHKAYGAGFSGLSFGWIQETINLDAYAGEKILLRFEVITDAAGIRHGMAIDDIRIESIAYQDGFESLDDTWQAQGWIRTDNRLPQEAWVQAVQQHGKEITLSRWLATPSGEWTLDLIEDVEQVLVAISPLAPYTMLDNGYSISFSAN